MKTKAIVIKCDKCGAIDILSKVSDGPSETTDGEGYQTQRLGWLSVMRFPTIVSDLRHLCPKCSKEYSDLFENFWKEAVEDQDD